MSFAWLSPSTQVLTFTTRVRRKATIDLVTESFTKPMKWLCPKASISSKRTRPPGAWRRVTLRPSMREHCWNPVAVTFHSKISEAVASCRILTEVFCGTSKDTRRPPAELLELAFPQAISGTTST